MECEFRDILKQEDLQAVRTITEACGFFTKEEVAIACELVEETLIKGKLSGYEFLFAESRSRTIAYSIYGRIPGTESSYDLYWIAVDPELRNLGIGSLLLSRTEKKISESGGKRVYIETSTQPKYEPTRHFYTANSYLLAAELPDFYADNDGKHIYCKAL